MKFRVMLAVLGGLAGIIVLALVSGWVWERTALWLAGNQLRNELAELKRIAFRGDYFAACTDGKSKQNQPVSGIQLRFTSETEYQIEPLCENRLVVAPPIKQGTLWVGVKRHFGSGVFIPLINGNPEVKDAWVELSKGTLSGAVGFFDGESSFRWKLPSTIVGGDSPAMARCADWGFSCCQSGVSEGVGVQAFTADCLDTCFSSCNQRPVVLFFNADPQLNNERMATIEAARATVEFGFEVTDTDGAITETRLDFGDGEQSSSLQAKEPSISHDYSCFRNRCVFEIILSASDSRGLAIADNKANRIRVVMLP